MHGPIVPRLAAAAAPPSSPSSPTSMASVGNVAAVPAAGSTGGAWAGDARSSRLHGPAATMSVLKGGRGSKATASGTFPPRHVSCSKTSPRLENVDIDIIR